MISKKRYWGLALPIFKCEDCENVDVIGSETELEERAIEGWEEFKGHSPHRPWLDAVKIGCSKCGKSVSRIPDVGNPWLDAGIVTFSTLGYRNNREYWEQWYPADWISESFPGQFRNWFYSLLAMSTALRNHEPTRAVFSYALMRDEHGEEMHKSKGNAIWFEEAAEKMGVDVMRWLYCRQNPSSNLNFGYGPGDEVRRQFLIPLWNVYSFFVTYANLDGWTPSRAADPGERSELDRWILSELNRLTARVTGYLENWRPNYAAQAIEEFTDGLSNWYVRRSRRRYWKSEDDGDKQAAYSTLYTCLATLSRVLAPFTPFVADEMYNNLVAAWDDEAPESVHLTDWPVPDESQVDEQLSERTRLAMRLSSLGRSARSSAGLKVRQPLSELAVELRHDHERDYLPLIEAQLREELNVKRVVDAADTGGLEAYQVRPNLPVLGPKYGREVAEIRALLAEADAARIASLVEEGSPVTLPGFVLEPDEVLVETTAREGYSVASDAGYAAAVNTVLTDELRAEGTAREIVRLVQNLRKSSGLEISDRIALGVAGPDTVKSALTSFAEYVKQETLAIELSHSDLPRPRRQSRPQIGRREHHHHARQTDVTATGTNNDLPARPPSCRTPIRYPPLFSSSPTPIGDPGDERATPTNTHAGYHPHTHARNQHQTHRRGRTLLHRPPTHPRIRRGNARTVVLHAVEQPAQRHRRLAQTQSLLRRRNGPTGRRPPRLRPLRRKPGAKGKAARGPKPRTRRHRGQTRQ